MPASNTRSVPSDNKITKCPSPLGCHCARSTRTEWCELNSSSRSDTRAHRGSSGSSTENASFSARSSDSARDRRETTASALLGGASELEESCRKPPIAAKRPEGDTHSVRGSKSMGGSGLNVSTARPDRSPPPFGVSVEASRGSTAPRAAALTCLAGDARTVPSAPSAYRVPRPSSHSTLGAGDRDGSICSPLARTQCDKSASIASRGRQGGRARRLCRGPERVRGSSADVRKRRGRVNREPHGPVTAQPRCRSWSTSPGSNERRLCSSQ
mmetsp:Transcript_11767/g.50417  ORF Transcript_11767/g.50417 Transcript_11767/m.50417 type:complete len:270 (+) Transcript_11767:2227-3036(+)